MSLSKFMKIMAFVTVLALVYTHLQMQIIELAYRGKAKEKQIRKLIESNSHLTSTILALKSSNNLGDKLLANQNQMQFLAPQSIVRVPIKNFKKSVSNSGDISSKSVKESQSLLSMLSLGAEALAGIDR